jgi:hypothetical protein
VVSLLRYLVENLQNLWCCLIVEGSSEMSAGVNVAVMQEQEPEVVEVMEGRVEEGSCAIHIAS